MSCVDQIPIWIARYVSLQEVPRELMVSIARRLVTHNMTPEIHESVMFISARYWALQNKIDELRTQSANGSKVLLVAEGDTACAR